MNDFLAVSVIEGRRDGFRMMHGFVNRKLLFPVEPLAERLALDVRHHIVEKGVRFSAVKQRQDVRMVQSRDELDLPEKSLRPKGRGKIGVEDFQRDDAVVLAILREIHRRHSATPKLAVDTV